MCFSADADLAAGVVVTVIGVDAIRRARTPKELPLAALPLLFGIHQLVEAFVWWGRGQGPSRVGDAATWLDLVVAFALSFWVPFAVRGVEESCCRRTIITALVAVGLITSLVLLGSIVWVRSTPPPGVTTSRTSCTSGRREHQLPVRDRDVRRTAVGERPMDPRLRRVDLAGRRPPGLADGGWAHLAVVRVVGDHQRGDRPYLPDGERRAHLITI